MPVQFNSKYNFTDSLREAERKGITLRELIATKEQGLEKMLGIDLISDSYENLTEARRRENSKDFRDGVEEQFAYNGFTALDLNIRRPLFNSYAMKFVPHIYGGGAIETDKGFAFNYLTQKGRLASGNNNKVNLVNSNAETLEAPVLPLTLGLFVGQVDLMKADQIGYDVIGVEGEAVRYSYQIELDKFAFVGHRGLDGTSVDGANMARGLLNDATATITDLETTAAYTLTHKKFESMTTDELTEVILGEYVKFAENVAFQTDKLPNKWAIYPSLFAALAKPANISASGTVFRSHLEYLRAQLSELARGFGGPDVEIEALPYLAPTASNTSFDPVLMCPGTNATGRTMLYRQDAQSLRSRLALDLTPGALVYDSANNGMRRNYIAFIGTLLKFYDVIRYIDNGTTSTVTPVTP